MKTLLFIASVMLAFSCSQKENATLEKAAAVQIESFSALDSIERTIQSLTNIPALTDSIKKIEREVAQWETEMIDIPGYESTHLEHNHSHSHKIEELTPEQMLSVQQELRQQLTDIQARLKKLQTGYDKSI
jgi:predicted transcriptional regulator